LTKAKRRDFLNLVRLVRRLDIRRWQLQEAKARLSEVVKAAERHGPQEITVRGELAVVVVSHKDFEALAGHKPSFVEFMRHSPLVGVRLRLERNRERPRRTTL